MRKVLASQSGQRKKFRAIFSRTGKKKNYQGYSEDTILLNDITEVDTGKMVADHIWFSFTRGFERAAMIPGVQIEFDARIKEYTKGYVNSRYGINNTNQDYKLSHPTKIKVIME